jgi:hypothetical protein
VLPFLFRIYYRLLGAEAQHENKAEPTDVRGAAVPNTKMTVPYMDINVGFTATIGPRFVETHECEPPMLIKSLEAEREGMRHRFGSA